MRSTFDLALLGAFEGAALAYAAWSALYAPLLAEFVESNAWPLRARERALVFVVGAGVGAALLVFALLWRRPALRARIEPTLLATTPILVAWAFVPLLQPALYTERPATLLGGVALATLGFERTLRLSLLHWPRLAVALRRPSRVFDVAAALATLAFVTWGIFASIRLHHKVLTSAFDLGLFENLFFNTLHGAPGYAMSFPYFGDHAEFLVYLLLPAYALVPRPETLLVLQAVFVGGGAVPLYLLARRWLGPSFAAFSLVVAWCLFGPNQKTLLYDFHFLTLSPCLVLWASYFFVRRAWWRFWLAVLLALLCREDLAVAATLLGLVLVTTGFRRRAGVGLMLLGAAWFVGVKLFWMARFHPSQFVDYYAPLLPRGRRDFVGVLETVASNPLFALANFMSEEKLLLALALVVPLALVPLRKPRLWPLFLPGLVVVGLAAKNTTIVVARYQYSAHFTPYLFVVTCAGLWRARREARVAAALALVLASVVCTLHFGAFFAERFDVSAHEVSLAWTQADAQRLAALDELVAKVPDDVSAAGGAYEGPHFARRRNLYPLSGLESAEYVLYGRRSLRWGGRSEIHAALESKRYGVVATEDEFVLLRRGAPTGANRRELRKLAE